MARPQFCEHLVYGKKKCRECKNKYGREYNKREHVAEYRKKYRIEHYEKYIEASIEHDIRVIEYLEGDESLTPHRADVAWFASLEGDGIFIDWPHFETSLRGKRMTPKELRPGEKK